MRVELDWQAANEDGVWETVATYRTRHGLSVPRWTWIALCAVMVGVSATSYLFIRQRYARAIRQITSQVQSVIDLEARALETDNTALFLRQQDRAPRAWLAEQAKRVRSDLLQCTGRAVPAFARYDECPSTEAGEVQNIEMRGHIAWVEVIDRNTPVRQARFYRQTDLGWLHTAPRAAFWSGTAERRFDGLVVRHSQRDGPHMDALFAHLERIVSDVDARLPEAPRRPLRVDFTGTRLEGLPAFSGDRLTLASPWLSGVPVDGAWDEQYLDLLSYWIAYARTGQYLRYMAGAPGGDPVIDPVPLNRLQAAIAAEYATVYSQGDLAQVPVLRRIVERHGNDVLPAVLRAVASGSSSIEFADRWLSISASGTDEAFFGALSRIEREAAQLRQGNTSLVVLLFSVDSVQRDPWSD